MMALPPFARSRGVPVGDSPAVDDVEHPSQHRKDEHEREGPGFECVADEIVEYVLCCVLVSLVNVPAQQSIDVNDEENEFPKEMTEERKKNQIKKTKKQRRCTQD